MKFAKITKVLTVFVLASLLSTQAMAMNDRNTRLIIGGGAGIGALKFDYDTESDASIAGKLGVEHYTSRNIATRFYLDLDYVDIPRLGFERTEYTSVGLNLEARFDLVPRMIGIFAGPRIYYAMSEGTLKYPFNAYTYESNNFGVGIGGGFLITPLPFLELELKANWAGLYKKNSLDNFGPYRTVEFGVPNSAYLSINLKF